MLVARFYGKARRDRMIGPMFENAVDGWEEHLAKLSDFWSSVMLTGGCYKGNPIAACPRHPIEPEFFDRWLGLWCETTGELFGPDNASRFDLKAENIAASLRLALFYRPGTSLKSIPASRTAHERGAAARARRVSSNSMLRPTQRRGLPELLHQAAICSAARDERRRGLATRVGK
jgi:hemoglobin